MQQGKLGVRGMAQSLRAHSTLEDLSSIHGTHTGWHPATITLASELWGHSTHMHLFIPRYTHIHIIKWKPNKIFKKIKKEDASLKSYLTICWIYVINLMGFPLTEIKAKKQITYHNYFCLHLYLLRLWQNIIFSLVYSSLSPAPRLQAVRLKLWLIDFRSWLRRLYTI